MNSPPIPAPRLPTQLEQPQRKLSALICDWLEEHQGCQVDETSENIHERHDNTLNPPHADIIQTHAGEAENV